MASEKLNSLDGSGHVRKVDAMLERGATPRLTVRQPDVQTMVPQNSETAGATPRLTVRPPKPKK